MGRRRLDPETRHRVMASIRKRDTVPERKLRSTLWASGIRGWRCYGRLPGTPDIVFPRWKVAVFVDGVWWHGHPDYLPRGRRGPYWDQKIAGNVARDKVVDRALRKMGWSVIRVWDLEVISDTLKAISLITDSLRRRGWRRTEAPSNYHPQISKTSLSAAERPRRYVAYHRGPR